MIYGAVNISGEIVKNGGKTLKNYIIYCNVIISDIKR